MRSRCRFPTTAVSGPSSPARPVRAGGDPHRGAVGAHPRSRRRLLCPHRPPQRGTGPDRTGPDRTRPRGTRPRGAGEPTMSTLSLAARDSATMFRRDVRHSLRFPVMTISGMSVPILFLLLFGGVFGHALAAGTGSAGGAGGYIGYLAPGILAMTAGFAAEAAAINVCTDMSEG